MGGDCAQKGLHQAREAFVRVRSVCAACVEVCPCMWAGWGGGLAGGRGIGQGRAALARSCAAPEQRHVPCNRSVPKGSNVAALVAP